MTLKRRRNISKLKEPSGTASTVPKSKPGGRDLTREQNDAVRALLRRLPPEQQNQAVLAKLLGRTQSMISGFRSGRQGISWTGAMQLCALAGADMFEVLNIPRPPGTHPMLARDMTGTEFMLRVMTMPGLNEWMMSNVGVVTVSEIIRAFAVLANHTTYPRTEDGRPRGGWGKFFADLKAGKFDQAPRVRGTDDDVRKAEIEELKKG